MQYNSAQGAVKYKDAMNKPRGLVAAVQLGEVLGKRHVLLHDVCPAGLRGYDKFAGCDAGTVGSQVTEVSCCAALCLQGKPIVPILVTTEYGSTGRSGSPTLCMTCINPSN